MSCDSSLTGHGAQHCGQRILSCAASGIEQKEAGGSRPGFQDMDQSPMARVTSDARVTKVKGCTYKAPLPNPFPLKHSQEGHDINPNETG